MERRTVLTERTKTHLLEVFTMLGDYGLPERSHLPQLNSIENLKTATSLPGASSGTEQRKLST